MRLGKPSDNNEDLIPAKEKGSLDRKILELQRISIKKLVKSKGRKSQLKSPIGGSHTFPKWACVSTHCLDQSLAGSQSWKSGHHAHTEENLEGCQLMLSIMYSAKPQS